MLSAPSVRATTNCPLEGIMFARRHSNSVHQGVAEGRAPTQRIATTGHGSFDGVKVISALPQWDDIRDAGGERDEANLVLPGHVFVPNVDQARLRRAHAPAH